MPIKKEIETSHRIYIYIYMWCVVSTQVGLCAMWRAKCARNALRERTWTEVPAVPPSAPRVVEMGWDVSSGGSGCASTAS